MEGSGEYSSYRFFPYLRTGWGTRLLTEEGQARALVDLEARLRKVQGGTTDHEIAGKGLLLGPGDVLGFKEWAVLRTTPRENVGDYSSNCLASIDFSHPGLPWLLSTVPPEQPQGKGLMPWICLIVLEPGEFELNYRGRVPSIVVKPGPGGVLPLPDLTDAWAWAHVHVYDPGVEDQPALGEILRLQPERASSRLLCWRRLKAATSYHAFVVPTLEVGRRSGVGESLDGVNAVDQAWCTDERYPNGLALPYYHGWSFGTGSQGDFEYQVGLLRPQSLPAGAGEQAIDLSQPGFLVEPPALPGAPESPEPLRFAGALVPVDWKPQLWPVGKDPFVWGMRNMVHAMLSDDTIAQEDDQDPWLLPPVYGRWHAKLDSSTGRPPWAWQLNTDPRHRAVAGLATRVVQKHQEELMASAWAQAGEIEEANQALRWGQLGSAITERLHLRHVQPLGDENLISMTAALHGKVQVTGHSVRDLISGSPVRGGVYSLAFRRLTRVRGRLSIRQQGRGPKRVSSAITLPPSLNAGEYKLPPLGVIDGTRTLEDLADAQLSGEVPDEVAQAVRERRESPAFAGRVLSASATRALSRFARIRCVIDYLSPQTIMDRAPRMLRVPATAQRPGSRERFYRREALASVLAAATASPAPAPEPLPLETAAVAGELLRILQPANSIRPTLLARLQLRNGGAGTTQRLDRVLAYPKFSVPTSELLRDYALERMVPGFGAIKQNSVVLMETNPTFVEVFLAAMNHEMGAELLWRGFPTDRAGSYFRRFWDRVDALGAPIPEVGEMHTWLKGLGEHGEGTAQEPDAVLLIRGELLWKYPNTLIYAVPALGTAGRPAPDPDGEPVLPIFRGGLGRDVVYLCFDLDLERPTGSLAPGYFFVFEQPSFEPRFGLDVPGTPRSPSPGWDDLTWDDVPVSEGSYLQVAEAPAFQPESGPAWGESAAAFAQILFQRPVRVFVHQSELV